MKKFMMALMAVLFLGATAMVFADETAAGSTSTGAAAAPAPKVTKTKHKGHKGHKGGHKGKKTAAVAPATAPAK